VGQRGEELGDVVADGGEEHHLLPPGKRRKSSSEGSDGGLEGLEGLIRGVRRAAQVNQVVEQKKGYCAEPVPQFQVNLCLLFVVSVSAEKVDYFVVG
jgi:hypothetical protein